MAQYANPTLGIHEFRQRHPEVTQQTLSNRLDIPLNTVKGWTRKQTPFKPSRLAQERLYAYSLELLRKQIKKVGNREYFNDGQRWVPLTELPPDHPLAIASGIYGL